MTQLAFLGGTPVRTKPFPTYPPYNQEEKKQLLEVLESHNWGGFPSPNTKAKEFAAKFTKAHDAKYGVCAANGTVTLELALKAAGIKAGDEVIVPSYTWVATASAVVVCNAVPVFVDVTEEDYTIDCDQVEEAITKRTRAVIPVHLGSSMANLDRLKAICKKHHLILIEDCAHAHGAKWRKKGAGSHGDFGSFSFQTTKLMTAGEGGIILTNDKIYEEKLQSLVNCGRKEKGYDSFEGWGMGYNYRITDFQAGVLLAQLEKLKGFTKKREENAKYLGQLLQEIEGISLLDRPKEITQQAHYQYVFKYDRRGFWGLNRDVFLYILGAEGISGSGPFYEPLHEWLLFNPDIDQWPFLKKRYPEGIHPGVVSTPIAHKAAYEESVWLHYSHLMGSKKDIEDIVEAIHKVQQNAKYLHRR